MYIEPKSGSKEYEDVKANILSEDLDLDELAALAEETEDLDEEE